MHIIAKSSQNSQKFQKGVQVFVLCSEVLIPREKVKKTDKVRQFYRVQIKNYKMQQAISNLGGGWGALKRFRVLRYHRQKMPRKIKPTAMLKIIATRRDESYHFYYRYLCLKTTDMDHLASGIDLTGRMIVSRMPSSS